MVKLWNGGWTFMKRTRRDGNDGCCSATPPSKQQGMTMAMMELDGGRTTSSWRRNGKGGRRGFIRSRTGKEPRTVADSLSLLDSTDTTLGDETASWRVENILVTRPPLETDWWEEDFLSSFSSSSSSSVDLDTGEVTPSQGADEDEEPSNRSTSPARRLRFRNVGYLTWQQVQHNWRSSGVHHQESNEGAAAVAGGARHPTPSSRRELAKGLANNREYEMKHRVRLGDLVAIYNEMWTEEWSE